MAVTSGFFNSLNNDRLYNAETFNSLFDVLYNEGIFQNYGNGFQVTAPGSSEANKVYVGSGEAWFDNTWIKNDATIAITLDAPSSSYSRYDAIVLDIDTTSGTRNNTITKVTGTASSSPAFPTLANETHHKQHPLAYILRDRNTSVVVSGKITDKRGQSTTTPPTPWTSLKMSSDITLLQDTIAAFTNKGYSGSETINGLLKFTGEELTPIDLLWENSSPTSSYSGGTITAFNKPLANYEAVLIINTPHVIKSDAVYSDIGLVGKKMVLTAISGLSVSGQIVVGVASRDATVNTSSIVFYNGYGPENVADPNYCIPYRIYGIKGVN